MVPVCFFIKSGSIVDPQFTLFSNHQEKLGHHLQTASESEPLRQETRRWHEERL